MPVFEREAGVFLSVFSLPSSFGIGDLGPIAYEFLKLVKNAGFNCWQILPLTPTSNDKGNSPYSSISSFAGNTALVSPELLVKEGLISESVIKELHAYSEGKVRYSYVYNMKEELLRKAFKSFKKRYIEWKIPLEDFLFSEREWIKDFALYVVLKRLNSGRPWGYWPKDLKLRKPKALARVEKEKKEEIFYEEFKQFIFYRQWLRLRKYARELGISIIGDIPYYVDYDSSDVWVNHHLFKLNKRLRPSYVGGVPPDYYSWKGQLWGNPVYDWRKHEETSFSWWFSRLGHALKLYDIVRLDHFRGLIAYWEIPARNKTAIKGRWIQVPYESFFRKLAVRFPTLPFIAEDLGFIKPDVREIIQRYGFPGMRVLVFAFVGDEHNPHLPHNYIRNSVVYTSTHDSNTSKGWFVQEAGHEGRKKLSKYVGISINEDNVCEVFDKLALSSIANLAVIPVQDIMCLGYKTRINMPGTASGNWEWMMTDLVGFKRKLRQFSELIRLYGRS